MTSPPRFLALLLCTAVLLPSASWAAGKKDPASARLAEEKAKQIEISKKAKALESELGDLKEKLLEYAGTLRTSEEKLSDTTRKMDYLRKKKAAYAAKLYDSESALGGLITAAGKYRRTSTPDILMRSDPVDAARAALVLKTLIPEMDRRAATLRSQLEDLNKIEADIAKTLEEQSKETKEINAQKEKLDSLIEKRQSLYQETESARAEQEEKVKKLAKESKSLEEFVAKLKPKSEKPSGDALPAGAILPVHGSARTSFGEKDELGATSKGITFETDSGAMVVTPLAGTVKFAGPFQQYRQILIIEHKGGYHSLIAGLGRIDTVVGASLSAGEPVGQADKSSSAKIYYELRRNGAPVNPKNLLTAQRRQKKT